MKLAFISDIHSNLEALNAVLKDIKKKKIDRIFCVGDIIGYNSNPNEVCEILKKSKILMIKGNHDANLDLKNLGWFNPYAQEALIWTVKNIKKENRNFLLKLPITYQEKIEDKKLFLVHGSPNDPLYGYTLPNIDNNTLEGFLEKVKADILVTGHTHLPFIRKLKSGIVINSGSVGQPRDGNNKSCYCILDINKFNISFNRVIYDIDKTAKKNLDVRLPGYLAERLYQGR